MKKIVFITGLVFGIVITLGIILHTDLFTDVGLPDVPPIHLEKSGQNVYLVPNGLVSLTLHFENKIANPQELADRVLDLRGVRKLYRVGKENRVFEVTFDPGYTSQGKLLSDLYPLIDDQSLF